MRATLSYLVTDMSRSCVLLRWRRGCLIICEGSKVSSTIIKMAKQHNCIIITTAFDTYTVARLLNQAIPVSFL